jgi:16S rRNA (guanine527-N7)-methyltransferase
MNGSKTVSRETTERLMILAETLSKWNQALNLVSKATISQLEERHIGDSAQLIDFMPPMTRHFVDIGSGGGFPGLVVAALLQDADPNCRVTLIEADKRKCVFLREAARKMGLSVEVMAERIEQVPSLAADVVSARALAAMPALCAYASHHLRDGGTALFLKGANHAAEVQDALSHGWCFDLATHKSTTDPQGAILELRNLRHDTHK